MNKICKEEIEKQRCKMMELAQKHGLTSPEAVKCSQELDHIMNKYFFSGGTTVKS